MALSSRELLLVLRARDEASRVLRGLSTEMGNLSGAALTAAKNQISAGSALVSLGTGMAFAGGATLAWLAGSTKEAIEFEKQIARVATQTDNVKASQQELGDIVKGVAGKIAVPLDELAGGLYDIFSSMEVTLPQSGHLLEQFAKEAVAGLTSLETASRATIGIMNAFHIPVEKVTDVLDVQFQLVRKGVGTFEQFAGAIGKATPSAARAGQSVETLSGMLAYLTRNGLSADMAAASAARSFDALAHPKTVQRLEKMGVTVKTNTGDFREMGDIMVDLQKKLSKLSDPERAAALQDLFKSSGGTIQARRFYDAVLKDAESVKQFTGLVGDMKNAQGAFGEAYDTMANTTAAKSQLLENRWRLMRIEIGEALIPAFNQLLDILSTLIDWWNSLDESTQKAIITTVAIGAALMVLLGIVVALAGAFTMLAGAAAIMGIGVGALLGLFALVVAGIAAVIAIAIILWKNWDKITKALGDAWNWLLNSVLKPVWNWIKEHIGAKMSAVWNDMKTSVVKAVQTVGEWVKRVWNDIVQWTKGLKDDVMTIVQPLVDGIIKAWHKIDDFLIPLLKIMASAFVGAWEIIKGVVVGAWHAISGVVEGIIKVFQGIIDILVGVFSGNWKRVWDGILKIFEGVWIAIKGIFQGIWDVIVGIWDGAVEFFSTLFAEIGDLFVAAWEFIWELLKGVLEFIVDGIIHIFVDLPVKIWDAIWSSATFLIDNFHRLGEIFVDMLTDGALSKKRTFWDGVNSVLDQARIAADPKLQEYYGIGKKLIDSFINGWTSGNQHWLTAVRTSLGYAIDEARNKAGLFLGTGSELAGALGQGAESKKHWVVGVFSGIASAVRSAANPGTGWAYDAGADITTSLGNGAQSKVHWLKSVFQGISNIIPQWKGPPAKDAVLLFANGVLIMQGLIRGVNSQKASLQSALGDIGADMSAWTPSDKPTGSDPMPYTFRPPGSGGGTTQYVSIHTPEIVPQRDAVLLGYELSRRVG